MEKTNKLGVFGIIVASFIIGLVLTYFDTSNVRGEDFNNNRGNWRYFEDTHKEYAWGKWDNNGHLTVVLGGVDNNDVYNLTARWSVDLVARTNCWADVDLRVLLKQAANYEKDEYSKVLISLESDGINITKTLATIRGDGNGGKDISTGWIKDKVRFSLRPGKNRLSIVVVNNKKTWHDEVTTLLVDHVNIVIKCPIQRRLQNNRKYGIHINRSKYPFGESWTEL